MNSRDPARIDQKNRFNAEKKVAAVEAIGYRMDLALVRSRVEAADFAGGSFFYMCQFNIIEYHDLAIVMQMMGAFDIGKKVWRHGANLIFAVCLLTEI